MSAASGIRQLRPRVWKSLVKQARFWWPLRGPIRWGSIGKALYGGTNFKFPLGPYDMPGPSRWKPPSLPSFLKSPWPPEAWEAYQRSMQELARASRPRPGRSTLDIWKQVAAKQRTPFPVMDMLKIFASAAIPGGLAYLISRYLREQE